jgi:predicted glutamine amidotransferase
MCTWLYKPKNEKMVSKEERNLMWETNPHGGGVMWAIGGKVEYAKGFTTFDEMEKFLMALDIKLGLDNLALVLHYRITTTKSKKPQQTHPFYITSDKKKLLQLRGQDDVIFCHNGSMNSFYDYDSKLSDTQNFSIEILSMFREIDPQFYKKEQFLKRIERLTSNEKDKYNRFCFLDGEGMAYTVGDVTKEGNLIYANLNHRVMADYTSTYYDKLGEREIMTLNTYSCGLWTSSDVIVMKNATGQQKDFVSKGKNQDKYAIDKQGFVYQLVEHINKYEFVDGMYAEYQKTGQDVEFDNMCSFSEEIVYFNIDKLNEAWTV